MYKYKHHIYSLTDKNVVHRQAELVSSDYDIFLVEASLIIIVFDNIEAIQVSNRMVVNSLRSFIPKRL